MLNLYNSKKRNAMSPIVLGFVILLYSSSCTKQNRHAEGEKLAQIHCASCHFFPEASILPRQTWAEKVLPNMGLKMGMSHGPVYTYGEPGTNANLSPTVAQSDWDKIVHYYLNRSEKRIPENEIPNPEFSALFVPHIFLLDSLPLISMTAYNEESESLYLGNASNSTLLNLDYKGDVLKLVKLESPPVKIVSRDSIDYLLTIGNLNPSDEAKGRLMIGENTIDNLIRPVDFLIHDLNLDGYDDVFICNYGHNVGDFSLYENLKNGEYKKRIIHPLSGAIKVEIANMDNDEEDEIVVLFAQEHELIMIWDYENNTLSGKQALQFQPAFGAVDFQLRDMNGDGLKDIIVGNGDNSDLSTVLKNYHGIRVFINNGAKEFSEGYFMPTHGVSKIVAEDFDLDGDTDIISISNFGDFTNPNFKSVRLLLNKGDLNFDVSGIKDLPDFRWQTIDVSDYDNDGDIDVFLGSFNLNVGPEASDISAKENVSWVRLENTIK